MLRTFLVVLFCLRLPYSYTDHTHTLMERAFLAFLESLCTTCTISLSRSFHFVLKFFVYFLLFYFVADGCWVFIVYSRCMLCSRSDRFLAYSCGTLFEPNFLFAQSFSIFVYRNSQWIRSTFLEMKLLEMKWIFFYVWQCGWEKWNL